METAIQEKEEQIGSDAALFGVLCNLFDHSNSESTSKRSNNTTNTDEIDERGRNVKLSEKKNESSCLKKPIHISLFDDDDDDDFKDIYQSKSSSESEIDTRNTKEIKKYSIHIEDDEPEEEKRACYGKAIKTDYKAKSGKISPSNGDESDNEHGKPLLITPPKVRKNSLFIEDSDDDTMIDLTH